MSATPTRRSFIVGVGVSAAMMLSAPAAFAVSGTVPNMYHCSTQTNQCWQTNPPHNPSIINQCYWYNDRVVNAAYAPDTCGKYTAR